MLSNMGTQVSISFGKFRLILRAPEGHTTGGGTYEGLVTEAVIKNSEGGVVDRRVFRDAADLAAHLCPGVELSVPATEGRDA